jgi:protein-L-isoaspartate(D-aspartate) O-methyltransferase
MTRDLDAARRALLALLDDEFAETAEATGRAEISPRVRAALEAVPREAFVPAGLESRAYENRALPIGAGQTISQPFVVALMTELLDCGPGDRVLEVGTGSGYQAAVLARLCREVHSVEVVEDLARGARERLAALGVANVEVHLGDGRLGWPAGSPYDRVLVTAATPTVPDALREQLRPGGRLVAPLGPPGGTQVVCVGTRAEDGTLALRRTLQVVFVPLVG